MPTAALRGVVLVALMLASPLVLIPFAAADARADAPTAAANVTRVANVAEATEVTEARAQIDATVAQMRATSLRVRDDLRIARRRGTRQQIACVDEALSRADVAVRRGRELGDEVLTAYARGDADGARAARRRLVELREAQRLAAADGSACAPRPTLVATSGVTVKLDVDPKIAPAP